MNSNNVKPCKHVVTKNTKGERSGWLLEVNSTHDMFTDNIIGQVYLTVAAPGKIKGFHVHEEKIDHFTCIRGNVKLVIFEDNQYKEYDMGENNFITVKVPPKIPHALYNYGNIDAYILNYCWPAWRPDHEDIVHWESDYNFN